MKPTVPLLPIVVVVVLAFILLLTAAYTVSETEQVIITQFGRPVGQAVTNAGLHLRMPFIQEVNRIEKRVLRWDGRPSEMPTKDKTYIIVDAFGRWRIGDAKQYYLRLKDERSALSRLDDILGSEIRNAIARHELIEVIRTTKDREPERDAAIEDARGNVGNLYPIHKGRAKVQQEILANAAPKIEVFGIELMDVQFKRINYNTSVRTRIYERMVSERQQIAERFRSEGAGEAAKILGQKEKDLQTIESEAYRKTQQIQGDADAEASEIYARAYNQSPEAAALYEFLKTMDTYKAVLTNDTSLILTTDSDFFKFLKRANPLQPTTP
ncbi:MAG: protease modulator HflC [Verrucomicrobia bacterium]|jgi:membrane protease subunit HflC|nr:protease modulator HflC [Verrucomicrobiota bacterium]OQC65694.1 MAG: Modulator of FtsH protease HflC [Verrucomicrobia bacterium ADurb.Bin006]MDI9379416.1 protease modulator HflC [Verrucomicrobiota bacterium]NMD21188.1 protease modulator HflC [Verrucomicrobiota bacterium]HNU99438.1 protease modulator HflC [Verrucomicrobiota bacterium]